MTQTPDILTLPKATRGRVLLPWQERWRRDDARLKLWEKSRRIGADYTEANDVTFSRLSGTRNEDYWYSSADESAAYEFAEYCRFWTKVADAVADSYTEEVEDPTTGKTATAFVVRFPNGKRMTAMSSNPRRFRSKGGDVGLSELAFHDEPEGIYDAAQPCILWGGRLRILTTHNGEGNFFNTLVQGARRCADPKSHGEPKPGDIPFSLHRTTIVDAVNEGLVEKINATRGTSMTREQFLEQARRSCRNEDQWNQEYLAIPSTDASAWLPYTLIESCESEQAGEPIRWGDGQRYYGMDIGEKEDPTVIWGLERVGDVLWTREVVVMRDEPLRAKENALLRRIEHRKVVRACVDATGVGTQIAQAAERTGKGEAVKFTLPVKDALASPLRRVFEDKAIRVPASREVREDLHSVRMTRTAGGTPRFDAERTGEGHGDRFWALALAVSAATSNAPVTRVSFL